MTERVTKPSFIKNTDAELFQQLRKEVNATVSRLEERRRPGIIFKAILFPSLYILAYLSALNWAENNTVYYVCYFAMGFFAGIKFFEPDTRSGS